MRDVWCMEHEGQGLEVKPFATWMIYDKVQRSNNGAVALATSDVRARNPTANREKMPSTVCTTSVATTSPFEKIE